MNTRSCFLPFGMSKSRIKSPPETSEHNTSTTYLNVMSSPQNFAIQSYAETWLFIDRVEKCFDWRLIVDTQGPWHNCECVSAGPGDRIHCLAPHQDPAPVNGGYKKVKVWSPGEMAGSQAPAQLGTGSQATFHFLLISGLAELGSPRDQAVKNARPPPSPASKQPEHFMTIEHRPGLWDQSTPCF